MYLEAQTLVDAEILGDPKMILDKIKQLEIESLYQQDYTGRPEELTETIIQRLYSQKDQLINTIENTADSMDTEQINEINDFRTTLEGWKEIDNGQSHTLFE